MSEEFAQAAPEPTGPTAGQLLRRARETAGMHVATLAVALKVPVRKLEALEEDRYDLLPDAVFVRALASSVCRTLKIDPQPILERLPQGAAPRLVPDDDGINAPFRAPGDAPGQTWISQVSRPVVLTVVALLLGAVVLIFLPARHADQQVAADAGNKTAEPVMPPASAMVNPAPMDSAPSPAATPEPAPAAAAPVASAPVFAAGPASAPAVPASRPASAASPVAVAAATPASAASAPATAASGIVTFRAKGQSWVKVTDAKGTTVFQKLLNAGDTAGASGTLPLSVTVGNAGTTEVEVRGQPFDLAPQSHDNVARFQVK
jgi:cytoskeleton protein RodZ